MMEPPALPTHSCTLTREAKVITMVLTATADGTDNPSTTRRIESVARDGGNNSAHRAHHPSITKAMWTRCLDESFNGGDEIVPDENAPILRQLVRMSFAEGGDDDDKVAKAFVKQVHETFTHKRFPGFPSRFS